MTDKKTKNITLYSPNDGELVPLDTVSDPVFAQKMVGDGVAIHPETSFFHAPCDGRIITVFPTKHVIGIETAEGLEIMMHVGIDTVELKGKGFKPLVKEGDDVRKGDSLLKVNLKKVSNSGKDIVTPLIVTNMDMVKAVTPEKGRVSAGDPVITIELNQEK